MHAHLIPSFYLDRVASTRTVTAGEPLRALAERLRTPLCAPGGVLGALSPVEQNMLKGEAAKLAEVFQRSSANVEGRNGYLSAAIPGGRSNPVTTPTSQLAFRKHRCDNTSLTGTI